MELDILREIRSCRVCAESLPLGPLPLVAGSAESRVVIIGQAPGRATHESGTPWADRSGDRLRSWLNVTDDQFYDPAVFALMPMGFCYPGTGTSGDLPPRPECAELWHARLLAAMPRISLTILIGTYALDRYIPDRPKTLTETVRDWRSRLPDTMVLPHPSPRNNRWLKQNPWFESETIPALQKRIATALD